MHDQSLLTSVPLSVQIFGIGAVAKLGATVMTYPLLLVKSRLMSASATTEAAMRYSGTWDALTRILRQDGACSHIPSPPRSQPPPHSPIQMHNFTIVS